MKPILNKWQITYAIHKDMMRLDRGWNCFRFGIFKLINIPHQGERIRKSDYKGFILNFLFWFPIERD